MRAVVYDRYGSPDVLHLSEVPEPSVKSNEIKLRLQACEVTKGDCEIRRMQFAATWLNKPMRLVMGMFKPRKRILGGYVSGTVTDIGSEVTRFQIGDEVYGCSQFRFGGYGEVLCLPQHYTLAKKPDHLSHAQAATVPLGCLNALHYMNLAKLQAGDSVLIIGAGGSIGSFAVQIAHDRGAQVSVIDAAHKADYLKQLGAYQCYDYHTQPLPELGERFKVIFNLVSTTPFKQAMALLTPGGHYLTANPTLSDMWRCRRQFQDHGKRADFKFADEKQNELDAITLLLNHKKIQPILDKSFALHEAAEAHRYVETEQRLGAVALDHTRSN